MDKIPDNKLSSVKSFFFEELDEVLGKRECKNYFSLCCETWLGMSKSELILSPHRSLTESQILKFLYGIKSFKKHEPLAHVLGETFFYGFRFKVSKEVLIPRPETEELVHLIVNENANAKQVLDLGTGSGCIAISLDKSLESAKVSALDVSKSAIEMAVINNQINNSLVIFFNHDVLNLSSCEVSNVMWDVIVSNPPYIPAFEKEKMDKNVVGKDPDLALFVPNNNPLVFYDVIANWAINHLNNDGKIYFEIHEDFGKEVCDLLIKIGFSEVFLKQDLQGKDRIVKALI